MAEIKINQNGELVNVQTGAILGNVRNGGVNFNSNDATPKSLQELGIEQEESPQENNSSTNKKEENIKTTKDDSYYKKINENYNSTLFRKQKSKYLVDKNSFFKVKFGLLMQEGGRFVAIRYDAVNDFPDAEAHWVKFRMWNYCEELSWKYEMTQYNSQLKSQIINQDKLNQKKLKHLLLDWSFGEYQDSFKLLHCDGVLSDESYNLFMGLYPTIASTIVDLMNNVLENNQ